MEAAYELSRSLSNGHTPAELQAEALRVYQMSTSLGADVERRTETTSSVLAHLTNEIAAQSGRYVRTFIGPVDRRTRGLLPGEVLTVIARPRVGKSAIASAIAVDNVASGIKTLFFSFEMPKTQALMRMVQQHLWIPQQEVEALAVNGWKGLTPEQTASLRLLRDNLVIIDRGGTFDALESGIQEASAHLGGPPRLVAIDYLGLIGSGARRASMYEKMSENAIAVKQFAKRHQVAVILLSQAGRDQDPERSEGSGRLGLDAARDSGQIEEAADHILTMWRPELSKKLKPHEAMEVQRLARFGLVKNRRGDEIEFTMTFHRKTTLRFEDHPDPDDGPAPSYSPPHQISFNS